MYRTRTHTRWLQSPVVRFIPTHPGPMLCGRHTPLRRHFLSCLTYIMLRTHMYRSDITPVNKQCYLRNTLRRSPAGFNQSKRIAVVNVKNCICFKSSKLLVPTWEKTPNTRRQVSGFPKRISDDPGRAVRRQERRRRRADGRRRGGARRRGDGDERN